MERFKTTIKTFFLAITFFSLANFAFASEINITEDTNFVIGGVTLVVQSGSGAELFVVEPSTIEITFATGDVVTINSPSLREISISNPAFVTSSTCTASASNVALGGTTGVVTVSLGAGTCSGAGGGGGGDYTPPVLSAGAPTGVLPINTTQTTLSLTTNENAICRYSATAGVSYLSMANTFSTTGSTAHSQLITGLTNGSSYNFYVRCIDGSSNENVADYPISFSVDNVAPDTQPPTTPTGLATDVISNSQINLSWLSSTDNVSVSGYFIYRDGAQITSTSNTIFQDTGLNSGTTYSYYVIAYDSSGNRSATSTPSSGTTTSLPATCSSFTYSAWNSCLPSDTQTRTVVSALPSGCAGGSPVTTQPCTYVVPPPPPLPLPTCGDATCNSPGETCASCPLDCGSCPPPPPDTGGGGLFCGDGTCSNEETCSSCPNDCGTCVEEATSTVENIINNVTESVAGSFSDATKVITKAIANISPKQIKDAAQKTKEVASTQTAQTAAETVVGVATAVVVSQGLIGTIFMQIPMFSDLLLILLRAFGLLAEFFGVKKRAKKWGVVYDAQTKRPLDPAYVTIYDAQGKEIESKVTDMDGRFGFLVSSGAYKMVAHKTNYAFPATTIAGTSDELYDPIYKGELIEINNPDILKLNIPMDPVGVDWNEQIKKKIMGFNPGREIFFKRLSGILFWIGLLISPVMYWAVPSKLNLGILVSYLIFAGLRTVGFKARDYGRIYDKETGRPIPFARIKVLLRIPGLPEQRLLTAVTDVTGRYYILVVGKGSYVLSISGTTVNGRQVTTEVPVNVKERVINFDLSV